MTVHVGRMVAAGLSVVVAAATGVVINLVTDRPTVALVAALGALVVLGVALAVWSLWLGGRTSGPDTGAAARIRQRARATGSASVVQAGRDVHQQGDQNWLP